MDRDLTFGYCFSALAGTWTSRLKSRLMVSTSCRVAAETLLKTLANDEPSSPPLAQDRVNVVLLSRVAPQTHGAMSDAYVGQLQTSGVRVDVDTTVPSVHLAAVDPDPNLTKPCAVEFNATHQLKLPQLPAVQSYGPVRRLQLEKLVKATTAAASDDDKITGV